MRRCQKSGAADCPPQEQEANRKRTKRRTLCPPPPPLQPPQRRALVPPASGHAISADSRPCQTRRCGGRGAAAGLHGAGTERAAVAVVLYNSFIVLYKKQNKTRTLIKKSRCRCVWTPKQLNIAPPRLLTASGA